MIGLMMVMGRGEEEEKEEKLLRLGFGLAELWLSLLSVAEARVTSSAAHVIGNGPRWERGRMYKKHKIYVEISFLTLDPHCLPPSHESGHIATVD
nr:hypothetical protein CFP56_43783 [Quercus suber]